MSSAVAAAMAKPSGGGLAYLVAVLGEEPAEAGQHARIVVDHEHHRAFAHCLAP